MSQATSLATRAHPASGVGVRAAAAFAALFGVFILFGVGFAQPSLLHNSAHDSRHAISFPCH
jgi:cobalt transporter subunit CbtB